MTRFALILGQIFYLYLSKLLNFACVILYIGVFLYTLSFALTCEVADTPTGVVMKRVSGNS